MTMQRAVKRSPLQKGDGSLIRHMGLEQYTSEFARGRFDRQNRFSRECRTPLADHGMCGIFPWIAEHGDSMRLVGNLLRLYTDNPTRVMGIY